jgi:flagellar export protein FliJ
MAKFVFQLEAVLEDRRRAERQRQVAVSHMERRRVAIEVRVKGIQARLVDERRALRGELEPGRAVALDRVRLQMGASIHAVVELRRTAIELAGVLKRLDAARAELLTAAIRRKAVEKLREQQLARWKLEQSRREAAELDDLTLMRRGNREVENELGVVS